MTPEALTSEAFRGLTGTDAATLERLQVHLRLLETWQSRINLVSRASLADPWRRHMLDSAQLVPLLPDSGADVIADIGSGAGFPGLVVAILTGRRVDLIDSDARKCAFLREAARLTNAHVRIHNARIEALRALQADVVMARACAPLNQLLSYAAPLLKPGGRCLFLKGKGVAAELTASKKTWMMRLARVQSRSDPAGTILVVDDLHPRDAPDLELDDPGA
ncbi:MAG: 16S rRNA (guanine(527)-N(7))-methyltransferase RsmG [Allosphingosinicella sp.]